MIQFDNFGVTHHYSFFDGQVLSIDASVFLFRD